MKNVKSYDSGKSSDGSSQSYVDALLAQIQRDIRVLAEDPTYHTPDTAFYMRRVREFKAYYRRLTCPRK